MSVNKVILVGNLGQDPELKHLDQNTAVATLNIATSETYRTKEGERVSKTEWHRVALWRGLAEVAGKYLKKGSQVYIEGKLRTRSWDDQEGKKHYITEVVGDEMRMLDRKGDNRNDQYEQSQNSQVNEPSQNAPTGDAPDDDLPF